MEVRMPLFKTLDYGDDAEQSFATILFTSRIYLGLRRAVPWRKIDEEGNKA